MKLTFLGFAALARGLALAGQLPQRSARRLSTAGVVLAALVITGSAAAGWAPDPIGTVAAWAAFVLTIPFMSNAALRPRRHAPPTGQQDT